MNRNNLNFKNNFINLALFLSVALISALLIMTAINMLDLPKPGSLGGGGDNQRSSIDGKDRNNRNGSSNGESEQNPNMEDGSNSWRERAEKRRQERRGRIPGRDYAHGENPESLIPEDGVIEGMPEEIPNIDISGDEGLPDLPFGMGEPGKTIVMGSDKKPHIPAFEVLGVTNFPFLKVMVMENYYNNRWTIAQEKPDVKLMLGVEKRRDFTSNAVKIKPVEPSKGYMPALSGKFQLKYDHSVIEYKNSGTYYAEELIKEFYEMEYETPPSLEELEGAETDDAYSYEITVPDGLEGIIDNVIENSSSDYEAIKYVEKFLATNYTLNNSVINKYGDKDGIHAFLRGDRKEGNYLDFISAYTFILRAVGIPCRLSLGYRIKSGIPYQIVYSDQTYIYPEVKFKEYGWVPVDVFGYYPFYVPPKSTVTEITFADRTAKRGTSLTVKGTVRDTDSNPLDDMTVLIYVKKDKTEPCLSYAKADVVKGQFEVTCDIKNDTGAGKYQVIADLLENDTYRTSTSDPELRVVTDTYMELNSPGSILGGSFNLSGKLLDAFSKEGITGLPVSVSFDSLETREEVTSEEAGKFLREIDIKLPEGAPSDKDFFFVKRHPLTYRVEFGGTDIYFPSAIDESVFVWQINWLRVIIALLLVLIISVVLLIRALRRKLMTGCNKNEPVLAAGVPDLNLRPVVNPYVTAKKVEEIQFTIEFPQISEGLPDVWGVGDDILIRFCDNLGNRDEVYGTFKRKGKYKMSVSREGGKSSSRDIRIVDYREEIIFIGKSFLKDVFGRVQGINSVMTLREMLSLIRPQISPDKSWILERAFAILEKAVYSERDIQRKDYEEFYIITKELSMMK